MDSLASGNDEKLPCLHEILKGSLWLVQYNFRTLSILPQFIQVKLRISKFCYFKTSLKKKYFTCSSFKMNWPSNK